MAKLSIKAGSTSQTVDIFIQNNSVTTGAGLAGLVFNTSGLTCYYNFPGAASTSVSLVTQTATGAWSSGGFCAVDATNQPGKYRLDIPNALLASGNGRYVGLYLQGAANMAPLPLEIELTAVDNQSTGFGLVNASANVVQWNGTNVSSPATAGIPDINVKNMNNIAATSITTIAANQGTTQPINFSGTGSSAYVKSDTEQLNAQTVTAAAGVTFPASVASPTNITAGTITTTTNLTNAPTSGDFTATMKTSIGTAVAASAVASVTGNVGGNVVGSVGSVTGAVGSVTGAVGSVTAAVGITSNRKKAATATFEFTMTSATTGGDQTGLTVTSKISKDGGAFSSTTNSVTEIALGYYQLVLTSTEMTANNIALQMTAMGATNRDISVQTQP